MLGSTSGEGRCASLLILLCLALGVAGCASAPPAGPLSAAASLAQKRAWILQLEDQRVLRDPTLPKSQSGAEDLDISSSDSSPVSLMSPEPDLLTLLKDPIVAIRRRAALAVGRVGLPIGVPGLVDALSDPRYEVREMAAFGLGLLGDPIASEPLVAALEDSFPIVQARAAEALGRIGAANAVDALQAMAQRHITAAYEVDPEEVDYPLAPRVEAFRSGIYALAAVGDYEALADTLLTDEGDPILWWWPVAHALAQVGDRRAVGPLATLAAIQGSVGVALAARGLGALQQSSALPVLLDLLDLQRRDRRVVVTAVRALAELGDVEAEPALRGLLGNPDIDSTLLVELVEALAAINAVGSVDVMVELLGHSWPPLRGAALRGLARLDPERFLLVLSSLPPDRHWQVRADLAQALALVDSEVAAFRLSLLLEDQDRRVIPSVLKSLVQVGAPDVDDILLEHLASDDVVVRKTAASLLGELGVQRAVESLAMAYENSRSDPSYLARAAAVDALARIGGSAALETLELALEDPDWAVRVRVAVHLENAGELEGSTAPIRPAPVRMSTEFYSSPELVAPSVSPHVFIETDEGTIQIELAVNEAPLTSDNFMALARSGFYDGLLVHRVVPNYVVQSGDPRSDSEGGPGYTIRDELSLLPVMRGSVGMALDWADTGGSQFFIATSPQPQLNGRYTLFGKVIAGMEVVDQLEPGDVIRRVSVWDGKTPIN
ncbi:MAG: hypothetical protein CL484_13455 [Acidobacteria bacterium]|nr:hypothetical protein [Acidobacteriota bacterium]